MADTPYRSVGMSFGKRNGEQRAEFDKPHRSPVARRRADASEAARIRPISDPSMNLRQISPPAMSFGELNNKRAHIALEMAHEDESREEYESALHSLHGQLKKAQREQLKGELRQRISQLKSQMESNLGNEQEFQHRRRLRESQLSYIDQQLKDGKSPPPPPLPTTADYPEDEVRNFAIQDGARQKPRHRRMDHLRMHPASSAGHPSPRYHGNQHIRQRSNPETSFIPPEILLRYRGMDPATSMGNIPPPFNPVTGQLDTSKSSMNSFHVEGGPSTNGSLQSLSQQDGLATPPFSISSQSQSSSTDAMNDFHGYSQPPLYEPAVVMPSTKVEMIHGLMISMLGSADLDSRSSTLLAMANNKDNCIGLRQAGGIPLLLQILHPSTSDARGGGTVSRAARSRATAALHNVVHSQANSSNGAREMQVLRLLEQVRTLTDVRRLQSDKALSSREIPLTSANMKLMDEHQRPGYVVEKLMQLSFKTDYRLAILLLGGIPAVGELLVADHRANQTTRRVQDDSSVGKGPSSSEELRKHCCTVLTNLTFGSEENKVGVCRLGDTLRVVVLQLDSSHGDLVRSAANLLRNLSWRANDVTKRALSRVGAVSGLLRGCRRANGQEATLRACTSALWNLSAHSTKNKEEICLEHGGLQFVFYLLKQWTSVKYSQDIVQNAAGILLNVSSYVSIKPGYRKLLREAKLYETLVQLLKSANSDMLKKVCGIVWNLSSRCLDDQALLWKLGAVPLLYSLVKDVHDKETQVAAGQALKNIMHAKPSLALESVKEGKAVEPKKSPRREPGVGEEAKGNHLGNHLGIPGRSRREPPSPSRGGRLSPPAKPPRHLPTRERKGDGDSSSSGNEENGGGGGGGALPVAMQRIYSGTERIHKRVSHKRSGSYGGTGNHRMPFYGAPGTNAHDKDASLETEM
eukprot:m.310944 g.310944  ORF g.310944 m.310944 type:complete len:919 (+) comp56915_c0_seq1:184-2940(+)